MKHTSWATPSDRKPCPSRPSSTCSRDVEGHASAPWKNHSQDLHLQLQTKRACKGSRQSNLRARLVWIEIWLHTGRPPHARLAQSSQFVCESLLSTCCIFSATLAGRNRLTTTWLTHGCCFAFATSPLWKHLVPHFWHQINYQNHLNLSALGRKVIQPRPMIGSERQTERHAECIKNQEPWNHGLPWKMLETLIRTKKKNPALQPTSKI